MTPADLDGVLLYAKVMGFPGKSVARQYTFVKIMYI